MNFHSQSILNFGFLLAQKVVTWSSASSPILIFKDDPRPSRVRSNPFIRVFLVSTLPSLNTRPPGDSIQGPQVTSPVKLAATLTPGPPDHCR